VILVHSVGRVTGDAFCRPKTAESSQCADPAAPSLSPSCCTSTSRDDQGGAQRALLLCFECPWISAMPRRRWCLRPSAELEAATAPDPLSADGSGCAWRFTWAECARAYGRVDAAGFFVGLAKGGSSLPWLLHAYRCPPRRSETTGPSALLPPGLPGGEEWCCPRRVGPLADDRLSPGACRPAMLGCGGCPRAALETRS